MINNFEKSPFALSLRFSRMILWNANASDSKQYFKVQNDDFDDLVMHAN